MTLRTQIRELAQEQGYALNAPENRVMTHCDIFVRENRVVRVGYTLNESRITILHVNDQRVFPAGKWPTIDALKAVQA
jgi:hypothetical protein